MILLVLRLLPPSSDPTSDGQISVYKCHPWTGNADTHNTQRIYNRVQSHTYYIECLKRELITIIWLKAIVATQPHTVKSLCFSVIPRSVMLTPHSTWRIYNRVAITHLLYRMSQKRTYYHNMAEGHLNKITAEASKINESINSNGIAECTTTT